MQTIKESPLFWPVEFKKKALWVLDETLIPQQLFYIKVTSTEQAVDVIKQMRTRAFGQLLVTLNIFLLEIHKNKDKSDISLINKLEEVAEQLNSSRPTFPFSEITSMVLYWVKSAYDSKKDISSFVEKYVNGYLSGIRHKRLDRINRIVDIMDKGDSILTHCNVSGELAMAAYICNQKGKQVQFFATETRPYFQGAKLTCWELKRMGSDVTLIADNAVGSVIADGLVNKVIVGSDRNCANGDFANKIGTYQIAVLAKEFNVPFYVLTQPSNKIKSGKHIPVEIRSDKELLYFNGKKLFPGKVSGFYPGFDVVPKKYITESIPINVN